MLSLKPPWKQKNPIMEKACQAYHKQTAPAKAREITENLKIVDESSGATLTKKTFVLNQKTEAVKRTIVIFSTGGGHPEVVALIAIRDGKTLVSISKMSAHEFSVYYKGEKVRTLSGGRGQGYNYFHL